MVCDCIFLHRNMIIIMFVYSLFLSMYLAQLPGSHLSLSFGNCFILSVRQRPSSLMIMMLGYNLNLSVATAQLPIFHLCLTAGDCCLLPGGAAGRAPSAYHDCPPRRMFHVVLAGGAAMRTRSPA